MLLFASAVVTVMLINYEYLSILIDVCIHYHLLLTLCKVYSM